MNSSGGGMRAEFTRRWLILIIAGALFLALDITAYTMMRQNQVDDIEAVRRLRIDIDTTRTVLSRAKTAADSAALTERISGREYGLSRIEFHIAPRAETIGGWWTSFGAGTGLAGISLLLIAGGIAARRAGRRAQGAAG